MKKTAAIVGLLGLTACVPITYRYEVAQAPGVRYLQGSCDFFEPRTWSYFPVNGIFVSLQLNGRLLGLHYPKDMAVQLDSMETTGSGSRNGSTVTWRATLVATRHGGLGSDPVEFQYMIDPITSTIDRYKRAASETMWASYVMTDPTQPHHYADIPQDLQQATIRIPGMTINGTKYESQEFALLPASQFWLAPVNGC